MHGLVRAWIAALCLGRARPKSDIKRPSRTWLDTWAASLKSRGAASSLLACWLPSCLLRTQSHNHTLPDTQNTHEGREKLRRPGTGHEGLLVGTGTMSHGGGRPAASAAAAGGGGFGDWYAQYAAEQRRLEEQGGALRLRKLGDPGSSWSLDVMRALNKTHTRSRPRERAGDDVEMGLLGGVDRFLRDRVGLGPVQVCGQIEAPSVCIGQC